MLSLAVVSEAVSGSHALAGIALRAHEQRILAPGFKSAKTWVCPGLLYLMSQPQLVFFVLSPSMCQLIGRFGPRNGNGERKSRAD